MKRKRGHLEIARDILEVARYGARPTALVYKANLNFNIIKKYLQELLDSGLIRVEDIPNNGNMTRLFTTTDRGLEFMESVRRTLDLYQGSPPGGHPPELVQEVS